MSMQIKKKFIGSSVVDGSKVLFLNEESFKALNSTGDVTELFKFSNGDKLVMLQMPQVSTDPVVDEDLARKKYVDDQVTAEESARIAEDLTFLKLDGSRVMSGDLDMDGNVVTGLAEPSGDSDAATKLYVDTSVSSASSDLQSELDSTQSGAGLEIDGSYSPNGAMVYISTASSLKDADEMLDSALKVVDDGLAQEIIDRTADVDAEEQRALAAEGVIADNLAQEIIDRTADVDAEELRATNAESDLQDQITQEISDRIDDVDAEEQRALAAEGLLSGRLDVLELDPVTKTYVDNADSTLQSNIDIEKGRIDAILLAADADKDSFAEIVTLINSIDTENDDAFAAYVLSNNQALADEVAARIADVDAEEQRAMGVEDSLQSELDATQVGAGLTVDGDYVANGSANYISLAVSLKDADDKLDAALKVVDDALAQEIIDRTAYVDDEESRAIEAEEALDVRVQSLEADHYVFSKERFTLTASDVSNGYIDLSCEVEAESIVAFVDRLGIHKDEDFTVSIENTVTRMTFINSLIDSGATGEPLAEGDKIVVTYARRVYN